MWPHLDERQRRLVLGAEAREFGRGGVTLVARAVGVSPDTVAKGLRELASGAAPTGRMRRLGGVVSRLTARAPKIKELLKEEGPRKDYFCSFGRFASWLVPAAMA